jgi:hypothetical protein
MLSVLVAANTGAENEFRINAESAANARPRTDF